MKNESVVRVAMEKAIIFSAGERGNIVYRKLSIFFELIAYCDNNAFLWNKKCNGIPILPPSELPELVNRMQAKVFIINEKYWSDIVRQLDEMGIKNYINLDSFLSYRYDGDLWMPVSFSKPDPYKKKSSDDFSVLYVQDKPCTRTCKMATALKERGICTYAAYTGAPSDTGARAFIKEYPFWTLSDLLNFVNQSEFDVVHCSNMPDELINLLLHSNKKIIYDMHDCTTAFISYSSAQSLLEYIATTQADGVMYVTDAFRDIQIRKYGIDIGRTFVIGNYPLKRFANVVRKAKLSAIDGQLHCVYEGMLPTTELLPLTPYMFLEPLWLKLAEKGVHVHIYSHTVPEYCYSLEKKSAFIHYEGNIKDDALVSEMTQYDIGLLLYNEPDSAYLKNASANKLTEYLSAGLPVVSNVSSYIKLLEEINGGGKLDVFKDDMVDRLKQISQIHIEDDFCKRNGFTVDSHVDRILAFYRSVIA